MRILLADRQDITRAGMIYVLQGWKDWNGNIRMTRPN